MKTKLWALMLALVLVLSMLPAVHAAAPEPRLELNAVRADELETHARTYPITFEQNEGGTIQCDVAEYEAYGHVYFTIKADPGYYVDVVKLEYEYWMHHATFTFCGFDTYHLETPDGKAKITVTFTKLSGPEHEITVIGDGHSSWTLDRTAAQHHETVYLKAVADQYYAVTNVYALTADGTAEVEMYRTGYYPDQTYEFHMPDSAMDIYVETSRLGPYEITAGTFNDGGTVSLSTNSAYYGDIVQLTILPSPGYRPLYIVPSGRGAEKVTIGYAGSNIWNVTMPDDPVRLLVSFEQSDNPFMDVADDAFYYDSVMWALEQNITNGTDLSHFAPNAACNRAQVVTFLWRAAGCPEPSTTENPFVDVQAGSFYEKAVLWAVENGITNGTDETHFSPNAACNRATVVTFLHRAAGSPAAQSAENPFTDVPADSWYTAPVLWAVEQGITNGMGGGLFGVDTVCNRAQIVTFLYRAYNK